MIERIAPKNNYFNLTLFIRWMSESYKQLLINKDLISGE